jgi:hypothetical protein
VEGLISVAHDGAVTGSVAGDLMGNEDLGAEIGAAVAIARVVVRSDFLYQPESPEARRAINQFERDLRFWEREFAACLRPKGYRVSTSRVP